MLWERGIHANPALVHRGGASKYLPMGWSYFLASYILPLRCFPFCFQQGFSAKGNFLTVFVCRCYRITCTALRRDELELLSGTGSKWQRRKIILAKLPQITSWLSQWAADMWGGPWGGGQLLLKNCSFARIREKILQRRRKNMALLTCRKA